ncbi:hypothetical protein NPS58_03935 [Pseudomonas putida]|nr:hypothetical protein [Pseudomonas putida]MDD2056596.1 hypothetical protein [Pseudomonas putida]
MNWTPLDTAQLLLLGMAILGTYCIVKGMVIANRRKREERG